MSVVCESVSQFRIVHRCGVNGCGLELGKARLVGDRVTKLEISEKAHPWFDGQDHEMLSEFRAIVSRLCKGVGHWDKFSIRQDIDSGIEVERL